MATNAVQVLMVDEPFAEWTPMHIAAFKGRYDVVDLMLQCGSSPNALDSLDHTPLLHSAYSGHLSVCQLLIDAGADVNHRVRGRTALKAAAEQGHADVCVLLIENGADPDLFMDWYQLGRSRSFESVLESMLEHGADLQDKIEGRTLLHYAARAQSYLMCEYLLMKGVDGNAQDNNGRTPLFEAFKFDIKDKSEFLELHKDSINKQLDSGLIVPVIETRMACLDFCELFARYGFDSNHKDNNGISLVEILEAATLDLDFGGDPILGILPKHVIVKRVGLESTFQWFTH
ncbi:ankyrin repeat-containing domain protein [Gorgonomyces haynaldii]|nr:ankyrin repeat-containing domain protein [Gorgonomyces haynaldii]